MSINTNGGDRIKISPDFSSSLPLPADIAVFYQVTENLVPFDQSFTPDKTPYISLGYANQRSANYTWGMNRDVYRRTPAASASDADFRDPNQNGRLLNMVNKFEKSQKEGGSTTGAVNDEVFERYMIHSPVGFMCPRNDQRDDYTGDLTNADADDPYHFGYQFGYASTQMNMTSDTHAAYYDGSQASDNVLPPVKYQYPNPYTVTGLPVGRVLDGSGNISTAEESRILELSGMSFGNTGGGNEQGDQVQAWAKGIDQLKQNVGAPNAKFDAYLGYKNLHDTNGDVINTLGIPYTQLQSPGINNDIIVPLPDPNDLSDWNVIVTDTKAMGFTGAWLDYGTNVYDEDNALPGALWNKWNTENGMHVGFEAVPRNSSTGGPKADKANYTEAAYGCVFPENSRFEIDGTLFGSGGVVQWQKWDFTNFGSDGDISDQTEVHCWIYSYYIQDGISFGSGQRSWTWDDWKTLIDHCYNSGIVVSFDAPTDGQILGNNVITSNAGIAITIQQVYQYALQLQKTGFAPDPGVPVSDSLTEGTVFDGNGDWPATAIGDTITLAEGGTLTIEATYGGVDADPYNDSTVPARFVTQLFNDLSDSKPQILAHPYGAGIKKEQNVAEAAFPTATMNTFDVYMSLNNGPWKKAEITQRQGVEKAYDVYSCDMPSSLNRQDLQGQYGFGEVRGLIIPSEGKPLILQGSQVQPRASDGKYFRGHGLRGCFFAEYSSVTADASSDLNTVVAAEGKNAVKVSLNNTAANAVSTNGWAFADPLYNGQQFNPERETMPIVANAELFPDSQPAGDSTGTSLGGFFVDCSVLHRSIAGIEKGKTEPKNDYNITPLFQYRNCDMGIEYNDTYDPTADLTALGITNASSLPQNFQDLITDGFGLLVEMYAKDMLPSELQIIHQSPSGVDSPRCGTYLENCRVRFNTVQCNELVDSQVCAAPWGSDVWNADLGVGSADYFISPMTYPWGPVAAEEIHAGGGYNYDFKSNGNTLIPNSSFRNDDYTNVKKTVTTEDSDADPSTFQATYDGSQYNWLAGFDEDNNNCLTKNGTAFRQGIWPTWLVGSANEMSRAKKSLFPTRDHHGLTYANWPWLSWGDESYNPHFDIFQRENAAPFCGAMMFHSYFSRFTEANRQGIFIGAQSAEYPVALWDVTFHQVAGDGIKRFTSNGTNQHYGPALSTMDPRADYYEYKTSSSGASNDGNPRSYTWMNDPAYPRETLVGDTQANADAYERAARSEDFNVDVNSWDPSSPSYVMVQEGVSDNVPADAIRRVVLMSNTTQMRFPQTPQTGDFILQLTGPGSSVPVPSSNDSLVPGTRLTPGPTDVATTQWGIVDMTLDRENRGRIVFYFEDSTKRNAFLAAHPPEQGFVLQTDGPWGSQVVTFEATANRNANGLRYNNSTPEDLTAWGADLASANGYTIMINSPTEEITWESFTDAQAAIDADPSVDLTGRFFRPDLDAGETAIDIPIDADITGGTFTAGVEVTGWTAVGGGIFEGSYSVPAGHPIGGYEYLVDHDKPFDPALAINGVDPVMARLHKGPSEYTFENPRSYNSSWWGNSSSAPDDYDVETSNGTNSNGGVITGLTLSGVTKTEFETAVGSAPVTDFVVQFKAGANRIAFARIASYNSGTGEIVFVAEDTGTTYTGYCPFTLTGAKDMISREREYSIDRTASKVYYRPSGGQQPAPGAVHLVVGSNNAGGVFNIKSRQSTDPSFPVVKLTGVNILGANSVLSGSPSSSVQGQTQDSTRLELDSCKIGYGSYLIRTGGWDKVTADGTGVSSSITDSTIFRYNQLGFIITEGARVTGCGCYHSEARSFMLVQNLSTTTAHGLEDEIQEEVMVDYIPNKTIIKDNYGFLPCCNHGQFVSAYAGSYLNMEISHNLIRGMRAAFSWQPGGRNMNGPEIQGITTSDSSSAISGNGTWENLPDRGNSFPQYGDTNGVVLSGREGTLTVPVADASIDEWLTNLDSFGNYNGTKSWAVKVVPTADINNKASRDSYKWRYYSWASGNASARDPFAYTSAGTGTEWPASGTVIIDLVDSGTKTMAPAPSTGASSLVIDNNLLSYDEQIDLAGESSGQAVVAFNGGNDDYLYGSYKHTGQITRNTLYIAEDIYSGDAYLSMLGQRINVAPYNQSDVIVENNVGFIGCAVSDGRGSGCNLGGNVYANLEGSGLSSYLITGEDFGYVDVNLSGSDIWAGSTDASLISDWSSISNVDSAIGGGTPGIRWSSMPTFTQINALTNLSDAAYASSGSYAAGGSTELDPVYSGGADDRRSAEIGTNNFNLKTPLTMVYNNYDRAGFSYDNGPTPIPQSNLSDAVAASWLPSAADGWAGVLKQRTGIGLNSLRFEPVFTASNPWINSSSWNDMKTYDSANGGNGKCYIVLNGTTYSQTWSSSGSSSSKARFDNLVDGNGNQLKWVDIQNNAGTSIEWYMDTPPLP